MIKLLISRYFPFHWFFSKKGTEKSFELVGDGFCRTRCYATGDLCGINGYKKYSSNYDECISTCENDAACTGFSITSNTYQNPKFRNTCYVYGNSSLLNKASWNNSYLWHAFIKKPYGFKGVEVQSSSGKSGVHCFKRIDEENISKGKL